MALEEEVGGGGLRTAVNDGTKNSQLQDISKGVLPASNAAEREDRLLHLDLGALGERGHGAICNWSM